MKNVLVILAGSLLATTVKAQMPSPVDSLKISKDVSLDEVVITATKVGKETPVAYSDISKQELSSRTAISCVTDFRLTCTTFRIGMSLTTDVQTAPCTRFFFI